ncbi:MAG: mechanosensitive ion channel family protein [Deltaproteobacteria bacterium]|nr:mechanosensitive ion channel family protein [Deltaproteobacteria bacterium]
MSDFFTAVRDEGLAHFTAWGMGFAVAVLVLERFFGRGKHEQRRGLKALLGLSVAHLVAVVVAAIARGGSADIALEAGAAARLFLGWITVLGSATLAFELVLPRTRLRVSRILQDLLLAGSIILVTFFVLRRVGVDLTSIVATSAVMTAVIGLSLQDTLGNTIGGLTLQLDDSIHVGDWIKVGEVNGRVVEIRWRFTAVETRNWETVYIPNSKIVKDNVTVFGKRQGQPRQVRRWVYFNIDFRHAPSDVIDTVLHALHGAPITNVAADPKPNCVLMDLGESTAKYAVRYWLTDAAVDDPTDGAVRTRIFFALKRKGIPLALPAHALFITEDNKKRRERKQVQEHTRRVEALRKVETFAPLEDSECERVADGLVYAPFTKGEVITRQGAEAHWLYLVVRGEVAVRIAVDGADKEVATMGPGEVFGEMSLLTGEPRAASVYALTDVECWRLDQEAFRQVIQERPEIAVPMATLLAERRVHLLAVRENLDAATRLKRLAAEETDLLKKMRAFFGL